MNLKHFCLSIAASLIVVVSLFQPVGAANTNNFSFSLFKADYYLSKDSERRSTMKVVENLTAEFPGYDQNKGIVRDIPTVYDGHTVDFKLVSIMRNGASEPIYSQENENGYTEVSTGTNEYLTGTQKYTFTYTLRDVTKSFDDYQELYWDTNGTGWSQPFDNVVATIHLNNGTASSFNNQVACYQGKSGSKEGCTFAKIDDKTYSFTATRKLNANENMTFVMGFKANTFAGYKFSLTYFLEENPIIVGLLALLVIMAFILVARYIKYGRQYKHDIIVAQYTAPTGVSLAELTTLYSGATQIGMTAEIIDLAVKGKVRLIESKSSVMGSKQYYVELVSGDGLSDVELAFIEALFGGLSVGAQVNLKDQDQMRAIRLSAFTSSLGPKMQELGYIMFKSGRKFFNMTLVGTLVFGVFLLMILIISSAGTGLTEPMSGVLIGLLFVIFCVFVVILCRGKSKGVKRNNLFSYPLTDKGHAMYNYLRGLSLYISLAEEDRLRYLQSPQGADRQPVDINDKAQIVLLYEKLLPYAVLFHMEKEWSKQLAVYYTQTNQVPLWYSGINGFNADNFSSALGAFTTSTTNSSTSGLSGGGMSGGGGGGGGGGGR